MNQAAQVEQEEQHEQVEQDEYTRRAYLIDRCCYRQGHLVGTAVKAAEQQQEGAEQQDADQELPDPRTGQQTPYVPTDIGCCQQGQ